MAEIVPVDEFLDWYPGWTPELIGSPWLAEHPGPFTKADEERFWFIDFHWPRGFSPMGFLYVTDCAAWGTQTAAHWLPLPPRQGPGHPPRRAVPVRGRDRHDVGVGARPPRRPHRAQPARFLQNFDAIREERKWELELGLAHFEGYDFTGNSLAEIGQYLVDARTFHKRAWEIHFELMYPLLGIYLQLYGLYANSGIDPSNVSKFFQGRDSKIMETDRAMWELVSEAKRLGVADLFDAEPSEIRDRLAKAGGNASVWLTKFDDFLQIYGWRTEGIADTNIPSWIENPGSPLGQIRNFLAMDEPHDFEQAAEAARAERDEAVEAARSQLSGEMVTAFDELLAVNQVANFAWWNEDHNYYIDLRASIPLRRAALAAACVRRRHLRRRPVPLLPRGARHRLRTERLGWTSSLSPRRAIGTDDHYNEIRDSLPKVVGTLPDKIEDPVLIEIFGMRHHYFEALKSDPDATELRGFPASTGTVTGRARVMLSATELTALEEGEILVCEATSPNWTPAFALIAGCVCDGGAGGSPTPPSSAGSTASLRGRLLRRHVADPHRRPRRDRRRQGHGDDRRARPRQAKSTAQYGCEPSVVRLRVARVAMRFLTTARTSFGRRVAYHPRIWRNPSRRYRRQRSALVERLGVRAEVKPSAVCFEPETYRRYADVGLGHDLPSPSWIGYCKTMGGMTGSSRHKATNSSNHESGTRPSNGIVASCSRSTPVPVRPGR